MDHADSEEKRPVSGRISINKIPFKRSGSSLEIIPPDDNGDKQIAPKPLSNRPPSRPSSRKSIPAHQSVDIQKQTDRPSSSSKKSTSTNRPPSRPSSRKSLQRTSSNDSIRQTQSAGSSGKSVVVNGDVRKVIDEGRGESRSSSADARMERAETPKKVLLPSVRRNYEQHGMPKDMALDTILRESLSSPVEQASNQNIKSGHQEKDADIASKENIDALLERLSMRVDGEKLDSEHGDRKGSGGKKRPKPAPPQATTSTVPPLTEMPQSKIMPSDTDPYYISHGEKHKEMEITESLAVNPVSGSVVPSTTDPYYTSPGADANNEDEIEKTSLEPETEEGSEESSSDDDDSEDEEDGPKAPIELLGEFMEAVMDEEWEDAEKLCKMVLIYEADNAEAKQFKPLIEEMLRREREEQLFSGSEEESSDEDSDDEDDENDEDEEDDSDEDSSSSSESESEDSKGTEKGNQSERDRDAEKKEREAEMMKQMEDAQSQLR